jgi:hypothetical protein
VTAIEFNAFDDCSALRELRLEGADFLPHFLNQADLAISRVEVPSPGDFSESALEAYVPQQCDPNAGVFGGL